VKVISREQWGARPPRSVSHSVRKRRFKVHWTVGCCKTDTASEERCVRGIQSYHMDTQGWSDIAYGFLIGPSGRVYEGRGLGVRSAANGNFLLNTNHQAIALIAGPGCQATRKQLNSLGGFLVDLKATDVLGHRDGYGTECPGTKIYRWLQEARWQDNLKLTNRHGYWAWRAWRLSKGKWEGLGKREHGNTYKPKTPRVIPLAWWVRLRRSRKV